jgi:hypothetical protein
MKLYSGLLQPENKEIIPVQDDPLLQKIMENKNWS